MAKHGQVWRRAPCPRRTGQGTLGRSHDCPGQVGVSQAVFLWCYLRGPLSPPVPTLSTGGRTHQQGRSEAPSQQGPRQGAGTPEPRDNIVHLGAMEAMYACNTLIKNWKKPTLFI